MLQLLKLRQILLVTSRLSFPTWALHSLRPGGGPCGGVAYSRTLQPIETAKRQPRKIGVSALLHEMKLVLLTGIELVTY